MRATVENTGCDGMYSMKTFPCFTTRSRGGARKDIYGCLRIDGACTIMARFCKIYRTLLTYRRKFKA